MKKVCLTLLLGAFVVSLTVGSAAALPPFNKEYVEGNTNKGFTDAAGTAKCNVCHDPNSTSKKMHNTYGKAVKKHLTKADYDAIKADADKAKKYILDGLAKSEAEKAPSGKTYGELIKDGKTPWTE
jgi:hypothetical protein